MGLLVDGVWHDTWYDTKTTGGKFVRSQSQFRNWITADGSPGPTGKGGFKAEPGRYHLYVSLACPWAHRTLIMRELKGLTDMISVDAVSPLMYDKGWVFGGEPGDGDKDSLYGVAAMSDIYVKADPTYSGRVTVPVLWDKQTETIVSNESSEIIRMFNSAFDGVGAKPGDYYPQALRAEIDEINERIYHAINNGVYKSGFATTQEAYEEAVTTLFEALDEVEGRLGQSRYLVGDQVTEADWRLFTTLIRFDPVYVGHFKCNIRRIADYPNLSGYMRELYQWPGVRETVNLDHIKRHYYMSHESINPTRVVPVGPDVDLGAPHGRENRAAAAA
ncbi:MAG: glutathione S-transferase family protein [Devosiaceae bacterium]|nr:glutathione S-transferase family protein [Devosiaceae bacterium MH13]